MNRLATTIRSNIFLLCLFGFLFALHASLPTYIASTFLSAFVGGKFVGILYSMAALITILSFTKLPQILKKYGNYNLAFLLIAADLGATLGLVYFKTALLVSICFFINFVATAAIGLTIDVFLESFSTDNKTGKIRGIFLTSANAAWVISPLINTVILKDSNYGSVFLVSAILLIPLMLILHGAFNHFHDHHYRATSVVSTLCEIGRNKNVFRIFIIAYLMQFFFTWMVIYTPMYLHEFIGFTWPEINIMFAVMLLPFMLIELPLGKLADTKWGEKEMLALGFLIMAIATGFISYVTDHNFLAWMAILFATRIGAAMLEIMSETYFFKHVDESNLNVIDAYRTIRPWAYVTGPIVATVFLSFFPLQYLFLTLSAVLLIGLRYSLVLQDTR